MTRKKPSSSCRIHRCAAGAIRKISGSWSFSCVPKMPPLSPARIYLSTGAAVLSKLATALASLLLLSSCHTSQKKRIAVVPKATSHIFWLTVRSGAEAAGQKFGVDVIWNGPPQETEYDRQMQIVDSMIAQHVDGLAVAAAERNALNRSLDRAAGLGIPVTVFDSGVDSTNYMTFLATDNHEAGR